MKLRLVTLSTLLVATASLAQGARLAITRPDDPNTDTYTFGADQCNATLTLTWTNTLTNLSTSCITNDFKLWSTAGECLEAGPSASDTSYDSVPFLTLIGVRSGTFSVKIAELPDFKTTALADGGTNLRCGDPTTFTKKHKVCGMVDYAYSNGFGGCGTAQHQMATGLKLIYDTEPPSPPTIDDSAPQDKGLRVGFTVVSSDTATVLLEVKGPDDLDWRQLNEVPATNGVITGTGLQNNVPYQVRLRAKDGAGNVSDPSAEITITPILTLGFWGFYKNAGGTEEGGCSVGAGLMPLLFAAFAFRRARKQVRSQSR